MAVGISSVYLSKSLREGAPLVDGLLALGFDGLELEYRIDEDLFAAMLPRLRERGAKVLSVHSPMPNPLGGRSGANAPQLSSPDETERGAALRRALRTLGSAVALGAGVVVIHLGRVDHPGNLKTYRRFLGEGKGDSPEAGALLESYLKSRAARAGPHLDAALRSLEALNEAALDRGLLLGVENRYYPRDIPSFEETGEVLVRFDGGAVRYWHDTGHGSALEYLGIRPHLDWLRAYGSQLAGMHVHDVRGLEDHLAPGTGELDFTKLAAYLRPDTVRIMEIRGGVPVAELHRGREILESAGF
jgi:sugar phosphate isomerase/epimerase